MLAVIVQSKPMISSKDLLRNQHSAFKARCSLIAAGRILPSTNDLLRLSPFFGDNIYEDIRLFSERAARCLRKRENDFDDLRIALNNLSLDGVSISELIACLHQLRLVGSDAFGEKARNLFSIRCDVYAAALGHEESIERVWAECFDRAISSNNELETVDYLRAAFGWAACQPLYQRAISYTSLHQRGEQILNDLRLTHEIIHLRDDDAKFSEDGSVATAEVERGEIIVLRRVAGLFGEFGREIMDALKLISGKPLKRAGTPDLSGVFSAISREFPHCRRQIESFLTQIPPTQHLCFRPTVFIGNPGTGKTRLCRRLFELLGVQFHIYNCGGMSDGSLGGTPRRWHSREPSLPLTLVMNFQTASPGIILDELEKAGTSRHNGALSDVLLGLFEPESSRQWHDPFAQSPVDLSGVLWLATANSVEEIPQPLRDRMRIIRIPDPGPGDLIGLVDQLTAEILSDRGLHPAWRFTYSPSELEVLGRFWTGGSIRSLRRYLEALIDGRSQSHGRA